MTFLTDLFKRPTRRTLILRELEEAHQACLQAQTALDYARSIVIYNETRIKRLSEHLKKEW